jgi:ribosomal protein S18 acetylase RimI-like enzyme
MAGPGAGQHLIRRAGPEDADRVAELLVDFNREFDQPAPTAQELAARIRELLAGGDTAILLAGAPACGLSVLRFRPSIWTRALECYLAELYVAPPQRGRGAGRALMQASLAVARSQGADYMDLGTSEDDVAARALYESLGFSNREGKPDGPINYYYQREL